MCDRSVSTKLSDRIRNMRCLLWALYDYRAVFSKTCFAVPIGYENSCQGIRGYISVMMALNFVYFLIKGIMFVKNNRGAL